MTIDRNVVEGDIIVLSIVFGSGSSRIECTSFYTYIFLGDYPFSGASPVGDHSDPCSQEKYIIRVIFYPVGLGPPFSNNLEE
jgi:hypothetical protein